MRVTVKYFGLIAELAGKNEEVINVAPGISAGKFKNLQVKKYLIPDAAVVQLAVNQNLNSEVELKEGDEVAFLPPFAGG